MRRICCISNCASHYRESIYKRIDEEFDCAFAFSEKPVGGKDILSFDTGKLKRCRRLKNKIFIRAPFYWQEGVLHLLWEDCDDYIILGEPFCISTWLFLILSKFYPKKRVFFWTHGWYGREGFLKKVLKKIFFKLGAGIFLYGNYARELMIKEGFDSKRLFVIHNSLNYAVQLDLREKLSGSDVYRNHFKNENPNLIFLGRLTKVKSLDMILRALAILKSEGRIYNLTLVGDGSMKSDLQALSRELGLENQVWFYGACYDEKVNAELLYNADLCVSPGNVGLTAIHSLMFGCPVLTHDNFKMQMPEFESIVSGKTGDFFEYGNVDSLAQKIGQWFDNSKDRELIRKNCFEEIDNSWNPEYQIDVFKRALS